jgi:N-formylglutamate amidohydrolase
MMEELMEQGQTHRAITNALNAVFHGGWVTRTRQTVARRLQTQ